MVECDCPFCPLTEANVNVCDVMIMDMGEYNRIYGPKGAVPYELGVHINSVILYCKNNLKQKVGTSLNLSQPGHTCNVERINKGLFKFCFHTVPVMD